MRRFDEVRSVTARGFVAVCVPTRIVLVPPDTTPDRKEDAAFVPLIEIALATGAASLELNSHTPAACGLALI